MIFTKILQKMLKQDFDTSNDGLECNPIDRLLPKGKNKKVIGKIMTKFVGLRVKTYR